MPPAQKCAGGSIYGVDFSGASTFGVSERKTVQWTVFREAVLPKARSTGRAARRTTCTTMRRRARWGTAAAVEGASVINGLRGCVALRANNILPFGQITSRSANGLHATLRVDYIHPYGVIRYDGLHSAPRADYIPFCERITYHAYAWITCRPSGGLHTALRADLERRIIYRRAFRPLSLAPLPLSLSRRAGASGSPRGISRGAARKKSAFPVDKPPPFIV